MVYERSGKNLFWSIKNSGEILDKLKARDFNATSPNSKLDLNLSCAKDFQNLISMVTWSIN